MPCWCCCMSHVWNWTHEKDLMLINTTGANRTQLVLKYSTEAVTIKMFKASKMNES